MKKDLIYTGICILLFTGLILAGLFWLALGITVLLLISIVLIRFTGLIRWMEKHPVIAVLTTLMITVFSAVILRVFVFEIYSIPTGSMEETLVPGDVILVEKLSYGPAMPRSPLEIPWFNAFFLLNKKAIARCDTFVWDYHRLHGYSRVRRGDVVVFRYPDNPDETYIKRCVGLPGDTLMISRGQLFVNGKAQELPLSGLMEYRVWYNNKTGFLQLKDSLGIGNSGFWYRPGDHYRILYLTESQVRILANSSNIDSVAINLISGERANDEFFFMGSSNRITDTYGPLVIPVAGMKIDPDSSLLLFYGRAFLRIEGLNSKVSGLSVPVRDSTFTVRGNYYFMMGDNRFRSNDSRSWGLVPEELIIGKAEFILWSGTLKDIRWERVGKRIQ